MSKPFDVERRQALSIILALIGTTMFIIGLSDALGTDFSLDGWGFWIAAPGVIVMLWGLIWLFYYRANVDKFEAMITEKSKANFVRNLDDLEYVTWRLPSRYDERLVEKKKEMGVK